MIASDVTTVQWGHRTYIQVTVRDPLGRCGVSVRETEPEARLVALERLHQWQGQA